MVEVIDGDVDNVKQPKYPLPNVTEYNNGQYLIFDEKNHCR